MRIWDVPPEILCHRHLLGEHYELHALWRTLQCRRGGYWNHPETRRWVGKELALHRRHALEVLEFGRRGWRHRSPLGRPRGLGVQDVRLATIDEQLRLLKAKPCECPLRRTR